MELFEKYNNYKNMLKDGVISEQEFNKLEGILIEDAIAEGTIESKAQFEEELNNNSYFEAVKLAQNKTFADHNAAIAIFEQLGTWRDAPALLEKCKSELPELEEIDKALNLEKHKNDTYEEAIKKLQNKTVASYEAAIKALEGLGQWKDAEAIVEKSKEELVEIRKQEAVIKQKQEDEKKKKKRFAIILGAAVVLLIIAIAVISDAMKPDLTKYTDLRKETVHSMSFKVPSEWEIVRETNQGDFQYYRLEKNGTAVAGMVVEYKGETDLVGSAYYDAESDEHYSYKYAMSDVKDSEGLYQQVTAGTSVFEVCVYGNSDKIKHISEFLGDTCSSFNTVGYNNPRTTKEVTFTYTGDTSEGTKVTESDIADVEQTIDTGAATGTRTPQFTLKSRDAVFKAGETLTITITVDGKDYSIEEECSTKVDEEEEESSGSTRRRGSTGRHIDANTSISRP